MGKNKSKIPEPKAAGAARCGAIYIPLKDGDILGLGEENGSHHTAYVALKYYDPNAQCLSCWTKSELEALSGFIQKVSQMTWSQIHKSGGRRGRKVGLGYTLHKDNSMLPAKAKTLNTVSEDTNYFELRVTKRARVHGFRANSTFFLVLLDKDHELFPE
jgi:hypothetical protein